jgi:hypothetical protein
MSRNDVTPRAGVDGWVERSRRVGRREERWLERTINAETGHIEYYHGQYAYASRTEVTRAIASTASQLRAHAAPVRSVECAITPIPKLCARDSELTVHVSSTALRTIRDEIRVRSRAIEDEGVETGGGIFGPPLHGWHRQADVAIATVAAASRGRSRMEIAYGEIEATEANMIVIHGSHVRRLGDWHVHPRCPAGHVGEPSDKDMSVWLSELDRIDRSRCTTRYVGVIATAGERGWASSPRLHAWVVRRDNLGRPICEPAGLTESRYARAA